MSLPPGCSWVGSQPELFHASVNSVVYSRVGEIGACAVPPGASGSAHASWVLALLPTVVIEPAPLPARVSHGPGAATLRNAPVGVVQSGPGNQQPITLLVGVVSGE